MARTPAQVQAELLDIAPPSPGDWIFPRDPNSVWAQFLLPLATELALVETSAEAMLQEIDPRDAANLLPDYQRVLGPDACGRDLAAQDPTSQQPLAYQRWTARGGQSIGYFEQLAAAMGVSMTIQEQQGWICGVSDCDDVIAPETDAFVWVVTLPTDVVIDWECGVSDCDDPLGTFRPSLMECVIRLHAPAHTQPVFSYTT
jgi:uncharacterized protein YmfQ (DUF2313 family)